MPRNRIVEEVRKVRKRLVERHGGFDDYFDHLMQLDQQRAQSDVAGKPSIKSVGDRTKPSAKAKPKPAKGVGIKRLAKRKAS